MGPIIVYRSYFVFIPNKCLTDVIIVVVHREIKYFDISSFSNQNEKSLQEQVTKNLKRLSQIPRGKDKFLTKDIILNRGEFLGTVSAGQGSILPGKKKYLSYLPRLSVSTVEAKDSITANFRVWCRKFGYVIVGFKNPLRHFTFYSRKFTWMSNGVIWR